VALALVHDPDYFPMLVGLTPVEVQLSGHRHGGQVRLPGFGPVILPRLGRIYHTGLYGLRGRFICTGRGLGMVDYRCGLIVPWNLVRSPWKRFN
jgi:uncharacterized protein